jgi:hypothetical protein
LPWRSALAPQSSSPSTHRRLSRAPPGIAVVMTVHPQSAVAGEGTTPAASYEIVRDANSRALGCEGIVSKRLGSTYRSGRAVSWLKVKNPAAPALALGRNQRTSTDGTHRLVDVLTAHATVPGRRFPPPWTVEETDACFHREGSRRPVAGLRLFRGGARSASGGGQRCKAAVAFSRPMLRTPDLTISGRPIRRAPNRSDPRGGRP